MYVVLFQVHFSFVYIGLNGILLLKSSTFLKNRHFIIQERFNKLMYGINTIIKCGTWQPVKFQLVSCSWNKMIFYRISELMLPTLIQGYDKKSFHFWSRSKTRDCRSRCHIQVSQQIYWKFTTKNWKFSDKKFWYFSYFCSKHRLWVLVRTASKHRVCYSSEPPHRGGSNENPQSMFLAEIRKIMYISVNPSFTI